MKKLIIILVVILVIGILGAAIVAGLSDFNFRNVFDGNNYDRSDEVTKDISESKSASINNIDDIEFIGVAEKVNVYLTDDNEVKVDFYGKYTSNNRYYPELKMTKSDGKVKFKVEYPKSGWGIFNFNFNFFVRSELYVDIYLPEDFNDDFSVSTVSASVNAPEMTLGRMNINTVSGKIFVESFEGDSLKLESVSGKLEFSAICNDVNANSVSGRIETDLMKTETAFIQTTSGKIVTSNTSGKLNYESVSGDIEIDIDNLEKDIYIDTVSGSVTLIIDENEDFSVDYNTVSGDFSSEVSLILDNTKGKDVEGYKGNRDIEIRVETVSGDMEIISR